MELEGHTHTDKGITDSTSLKMGGTGGQEVGIIMVEESTLADTNSDVVESSVQAEVDLPRIVPHTNKEEGSQFSHTCWEEQD